MEGINQLTVRTFFTHYAALPLSSNLSSKEKCIAVAATILFTLFSLGLFYPIAWVMKECFSKKNSFSPLKYHYSVANRVITIDNPRDYDHVAIRSFKAFASETIRKNPPQDMSSSPQPGQVFTFLHGGGRHGRVLFDNEAISIGQAFNKGYFSTRSPMHCKFEAPYTEYSDASLDKRICDDGRVETGQSAMRNHKEYVLSKKGD